jgi:PAS domain S-box-containing protein
MAQIKLGEVERSAADQQHAQDGPAEADFELPASVLKMGAFFAGLSIFGGIMLLDLSRTVQRKTRANSISRPGAIWLAIAVGVAYFLTAQLGRAFLTDSEGLAVFWLGSGVAVGILVALGVGAQVAVVAGVTGASLATNLLSGTSILLAFAFAICNASEAALAAWLIEHWSGPTFRLDKLRHVVALFVAAGVAAAAASAGSAVAMTLLGSSTAPMLNIWRVWFAADSLGIVSTAPLLIGLVALVRDAPSWRELLEGTLAVLVIAVTNGIALALLAGPWSLITPASFLVPPLLWLGSRYRPEFAAVAAFALAVTIVLARTHAIGRYGDLSQPIEIRIVAAQISILGITLAALGLASLFAERRQNVARLQEALTVGEVMAFEWDLGTGLSQRSENTSQILGVKSHGESNEFLARIHPDDWAHFQAHVYGVCLDRPSYSTRFRFIRPDGREVWLEEMARAEFDAEGNCVRIKGLTRDITRRKQGEERRNLLVAELDHRVKNVLARVGAVVRHTRRRCGTVDDFVKALDGRIQSIAAAHALLSQSRWSGVSLTELIRHQLAPYTTDANITISGPDVTLTSAETQAVAMVIHELATNAAKHGALSTPDGRVSVSWDRTGAGAAAILTITWRELGSEPIAALARSGYGLSLIRDLIPHELGGTVDLKFPPEGACCKIEIPVGRQ